VSGKSERFSSPLEYTNENIISVYPCVINTMNSAREKGNNSHGLWNILTDTFHRYFHRCKIVSNARLYLYFLSIISNVYINLYWTRTSTFTSNDKCISRCSIELKNNGGNIISSFHIVWVIFVSSLSMCCVCNLLEHISLKK